MTTLRITFLVLAGLLLSDTAGAATAKAATAGAFGTREQLRECMALDDSLKLRSAGIEAATAASNQKFDANEAEAARLVDMKKNLDRTDKTAIATFNQLVVDHNLHVQQAHQAESDTEMASNILATDKAAADQKCGGLTYRPGDIDAVSKERKKAAAVAAAASSP